ncbi:Uncharacterised protein [Mycobacteroides abscessus subsp. abscessus]|nr:Uncharacterised protein [Mycobacteroides abscessus subsp. abscessus]
MWMEISWVQVVVTIAAAVICPARVVPWGGGRELGGVYIRA